MIQKSFNIDEYNDAVKKGREDFLAGRIPKNNPLHSGVQSGLRPSTKADGSHLPQFDSHLPLQVKRSAETKTEKKAEKKA